MRQHRPIDPDRPDEAVRSASAPDVAAPTLQPESILALQRSAGNAAVARAIAARQSVEPADVGTAAVEGPGAAVVTAMEAAGAAVASAGAAALGWLGELFGGAAGAGGATAPGTTVPGAAPAGPGTAPASPGTAPAGPATAPAAPVAAEPTISYGANAVESAMTPKAIAVLKDVLKASGEASATVTSTARTAADQARAMYQNLVGSGKGQGVKAQRALYGPAGEKVIDVFEKLSKEKKSATEIKQGMTDKILEIGPAKVSRHCADFTKLVVFDVGPKSITDQKKFVAAAMAEWKSGGRMSNFIPWPKDPGHHFEVPV